MSAVASSPSTPGRDSAVTSRSSSSVRLAMAIGSPGRAQRAAGRMVAGDDHQLAVRRRTAPACGARPAAA